MTVVLDGQVSFTGTQSSSSAFTVNLSATVTQNSVNSSSLFEQGTYALGSLALSSVVYQAQSVTTVSAAQLLTVTQAGSSTQSSSQSGEQSGLNGIDINADSSGNSATQSSTDTSNDYLNSLATAVQSYSVYQAGSYADQSYAFTSLVYRETDSSTVSTLDTQTATQSGTQGGTAFSNPVSLSSITFGTGFLAMNVSYNSQLTANLSFSNASFSSGLTQVRTEQSTSSYSLYEAGNYTVGTYNLSSVVANVAATDSLSLTVVQQQSSYQAAGQSNSAAASVAGGQSNANSQSSSSASGTGVLSSTVSFSLTAQGSLSYNAHEEGTYSNGSYSLSSITEAATLAATQSSTQVSVNSSTQTGSDSGSFSMGSQTLFSGNNSYQNSDSFTDTLTDQRSFSMDLYAAGSASGPSLSLSSFVLSESSYDTQADSHSESGVESISGVNGTNAFSGTDTTSINDSVSQNAATNWYEAGSYTNAQFNLSSVSYTISQNTGFTFQRTQLEGWTGSFSGSDNFTATANGSGSMTETGQGQYAANSWALSSYTLSASSGAQLTSTESGNSTASFGHQTDWSQQGSDYQTGTYNGGFSFVSFSHQLTSTETLGQGSGGPANASTTNFQSDSVSGSGHWGTETVVQSSGYQSSSDPQSNSTSTVTTVPLPGHNLSLQLPDSGMVAMGLAAAGSLVPGSKALLGTQGMGLPLPSAAGVSWSAIPLGGGWWVQPQMTSWASGALGWQISRQALTPAAPGGSFLGQPGTLPWTLQANEQSALWLSVGLPEIMGRMRALGARPTLDALALAASQTWQATAQNMTLPLNWSWYGAISGAIVGAVVGFLSGNVVGGIIGGVLGFIGGGLFSDASAVVRAGAVGCIHRRHRGDGGRAVDSASGGGIGHAGAQPGGEPAQGSGVGSGLRGDTRVCADDRGFASVVAVRSGPDRDGGRLGGVFWGGERN